MKGLIVSYRRGRRTQYNNQMIIQPTEDVDSEDLIGKTVIYETKNKEIKGEITSLHGKKGRVRALFEKGMPGQSLNQEVTIK